MPTNGPVVWSDIYGAGQEPGTFQAPWLRRNLPLIVVAIVAYFIFFRK